MAAEGGGGSPGSLEARPGILLVGSPNVGKRSLLSRLLSIDIPDTHDLSSGVLCQGWTIDTKYYSADLSIWTAHLDEGFSFRSLPNPRQLAALVMVFDMSEESSFLTLKSWVANTDIKKFEILLCIGNKADLVPGHHAHTEYRRRKQKHRESSSDPHTEYFDYGIDETEGFSLLRDEEPSIEIRKSSLEWCVENNIEYIEACAANADFDKCLSVDGDIQGVDRLFGALSAHMWPGMILKSGNRIATPSLVEKEETTDDESDYEIEYEVLSDGSDEPWQGAAGTSKSSEHEIPTSSSLPNDLAPETVLQQEAEDRAKLTEDNDQKQEANPSSEQKPKAEAEMSGGVEANDNNTNEVDEDEHYGLDDLERLMSEIGNMRANLRLMPDFQRKEMAAKIAMKMAAMFDEGSDEDGV
ncbi:uncharacterized protein LOC109715544 [Ananas comosus]|uniref:Uncharacterized protein LOC109715544 n=1 Tax=Ananas comosus TaxID=4615 RepID=A0A6P5FSY0_ANACO|nr:uncharacterized protein LOC109715544 [Ananas comosus]